MRGVLPWLAERLDEPTWSAKKTKLEGRFEGRRASFELRATHHANGVTYETIVDVATEPGARVLLHVKRADQSVPRARREKLAIDLEFADPAFDAAFDVEGAPERNARALLDEGVRRLLVESRADQLFSTGTGYRLLAGGLVEDRARALAMVRAVARVEALAEAVRADNLLADAGSGYRGTSELAARDHEAMADLAIVRARRHDAELRRRRAVAIGCTAVFALLFVFGLLARR